MSLMSYLDFFRGQPRLRYAGEEHPQVRTHFSFIGRKVWAVLQYASETFFVLCAADERGRVTVSVCKKGDSLRGVKGLHGLRVSLGMAAS